MEISLHVKATIEWKQAWSTQAASKHLFSSKLINIWRVDMTLTQDRCIASSIWLDRSLFNYNEICESCKHELIGSSFGQLSDTVHPENNVYYIMRPSDDFMILQHWFFFYPEAVDKQMTSGLPTDSARPLKRSTEWPSFDLLYSYIHISSKWRHLLFYKRDRLYHQREWQPLCHRAVF